MPHTPSSSFSRKFMMLVLFGLCGSTFRAQPPRMMAFDYIDAYREEAMRQMLTYRIPASVILAQAIFESGCGKSDLAKRSNNHFGIKCHVAWMGDTVLKTDDAADECFRKYRKVQDSYTDHSLFLRTRPRYAWLFALELTDYRGWCRGLKEAGYATYPAYAEELIRIIEQNRLFELDAAERLEAVPIYRSCKATLRPSHIEPRAASLSDLCRHDLLFSDERDYVLRSLDMILTGDEESRIMARR